MRSASRTISGLVPLGAEDYGRADGPPDYTRRIRVRRRPGPPQAGAVDGGAACPCRDSESDSEMDAAPLLGQAMARARSLPRPRKRCPRPAAVRPASGRCDWAGGRPKSAHAQPGPRLQVQNLSLRSAHHELEPDRDCHGMVNLADHHRDLKLHPLLSVEQRQP